MAEANTAVRSNANNQGRRAPRRNDRSQLPREEKTVRRTGNQH